MRFSSTRRAAATLVALFSITSLPLGCGSSGDDAADPDASVELPDGGVAAVDASHEPPPPPPLPKNIKHVVVIAQENHTFDAYFGHYCTAPAGSNPTCNDGPTCCEAAPAHEPSGASPVVLDDAANAGYDPNHTRTCELTEMNGGAMDRYVTGVSCSNAKNFAIATDALMATYHDYASSYALADRYFQPIVGSTSANDMYFAVAKYVFTDNDYKPDSNGAGCTLPATKITYKGQKTIADLLIAAGHSFGFYAEGYHRMINSALCPSAPSDCPAKVPTTPCDYDPSDNPFQYYEQFRDNPLYMKDYDDDFAVDVGAGRLPELAFVKAVQYKNEHPGYGTTISAGVAFVKKTVDLILGSAYANDTLIVFTWDEGGGFFDHVAPPPQSTVDFQQYGTRIPMLAIGKFARKNYVSHVVMEHSSVVRFIEWNFLDATGQLDGRDAVVPSIGSLIDPTTTRVPDQ